MSNIPSADAKAVVRAAEALTTQVRRIADALTTPVAIVRDGVMTPLDDAPTTPATTCSARYTGPDNPPTACIRAAHHEHPFHTNEGGWNWRDDVAVYPIDPSALPPNRLRQHLPPYPEQQAPAADGDAQRAARRVSLRSLIEGVRLGVSFSGAEEDAFAAHLETEIREADTARAVAAGNKRHVQTIMPEIDRLGAELGDYERRVEQLEDLLRVANETSNRSETERASAVQRAEAADRVRAEVQRDRDQHAAVLSEVLRSFRHETHPGRRCLQSEHVPVEEVERWRSVVAPTVERPWWVDVAEIRAELEEAQAAIERVRAVGDDPLNGHPASGPEQEAYVRGWSSAIHEVLRALDGAEQPTTEA